MIPRRLLLNSIFDAGMSKDTIQIKCPAKPITHAFLQFTDSEERDKFFQIREHAEKRIKKKKNKNISCHGCRRKMSTEKTGIHQVPPEPKA